MPSHSRDVNISSGTFLDVQGDGFHYRCEVRYNDLKSSTNYSGQSANNTRELGTGGSFNDSTLSNGDSTYYEQSNNYSGQVYRYDYRVETYVGVQRSELKGVETKLNDIKTKMACIEARSNAHENDISTLKSNVRSLLQSKKIEESPDELQGSPAELQRRINELEAKNAFLLQYIRVTQGDSLAALLSTASPSAMSPPRSLLLPPPLPSRLHLPPKRVRTSVRARSTADPGEAG
jgi:hypothetical protein